MHLFQANFRLTTTTASDTVKYTKPKWVSGMRIFTWRTLFGLRAARRIMSSRTTNCYLARVCEQAGKLRMRKWAALFEFAPARKILGVTEVFEKVAEPTHLAYLYQFGTDYKLEGVWIKVAVQCSLYSYYTIMFGLFVKVFERYPHRVFFVSLDSVPRWD